ncbi:MAG TPA: hypothetical protein VF665_20825 [Longimicrobium sp.]|jgi:hypothetical protein|uniref:amidohydrolase family protein n=1 Tax=Longimicrobium sp. TaxID=2029185 RepID=UPI002EDB0DB1
MRRLVLCSVALTLTLLAACAGARTAASPPAASGYELSNGRWWDGERFAPRTMYVVGGRFAARRPARVDSVVNLGGGYVVPPFGDAHAHHFEAAWMIARIDSMYLRDGVFYGMSLTNWANQRPAVMPYLGRTETMDVAFADAGITGPYGHPILVYESLARGRYDFNPDSIRPWTDRRAEGKAYFIVDSERELDEAWPRVMASRPDIIKTYLVESEHHARLRLDTTRLGHVGLDPALLPSVVRRAHAAGLRVAAHVETVADMRAALDAGVDVLAHLPGYNLPAGADPATRTITEADARRAARQGMVVIAGPLRAALDLAETDTARFRETMALHRANVGVLHRAGVRLAAGSDAYGQDPVPEMAYIHGLGVLGNAALLRMWSQDTPATIFPARRIGRLAPEWEASLLVLACDPLGRWECTGDIRMRIKEGMRITLPPQPAR